MQESQTSSDDSLFCRQESDERDSIDEKRQTRIIQAPHELGETPIVEEDLRNKTRMGRQSLVIQPQPEPRFIKEYRLKKGSGSNEKYETLLYK